MNILIMGTKLMIREEIIKDAAHEYIITDKTCGVGVRTQAFIDGAKWADEHPASPWHSVKDGEVPQEAKDCIFSYQGELYKGFMFDDKSLHFDDEFSPTLDININEVDYWMEIPKLPTE